METYYFVLAFLELKNAGSRDIINVENKNILERVDIAKAELTSLDGKHGVSLSLTAQGAKKLQQYTKDHVGENLGVVIKDKLVSAPKINAPIVGPNLVLSGMSKAEATGIVKQINEMK